MTVLPPGEWDPQIRIDPPDNLPSPTTRVATVADVVGKESPKVPRMNSVAGKQQVEELVNFHCEKRYVKCSFQIDYATLSFQTILWVDS